MASMSTSSWRLSPVASAGKRATEQVRLKNSYLADQLRKERDARLSRHLSRAPKGTTSATVPKVASHREQVVIAEMLNRRMIELFIDPAERNWYKFFVHMDDDCSGKVNYEELVDMIRNELRIGTSQLSETKLEAIWRALDEDNSGLISSGEFGHFMRLGEHVHGRRVPWKERNLKANTAVAASVRKEKGKLLGALKERLDLEEEQRRRKAGEVYNSVWGSQSLDGSTATPRVPWRSPRARIF